jgi:hypothetical protein
MLFLNRLPRLHHPLLKNRRFARVTHDAYFLVIETTDRTTNDLQALLRQSFGEAVFDTAVRDSIRIGEAPGRLAPGAESRESCDPVQHLWNKRAPMITPRDHHAVGVVDGKLYAIAGRINGNHDRSVGDNEEYDAAGNRWRTRASIPTVRSGIVAATLGGKIFVFGGEYGRRTHANVESYDPAKNKWQGWAPMPTARHGLGAAVIGNSIYVISGGPQPGASFSSVNEVLTP